MSKELLNMTLGEIAAEATNKIRNLIDKELPGDMEATMPWRVNDIICDVVGQYLPKKALHDAGLKCWITCDGSAAYKQVAQVVNLSLNFRKSHPHYSGSFKDTMFHHTVALLSIKRTQRTCQGKRHFVFKELVLASSGYKKRTVMDLADMSARMIIVGQERYWNAAKVLMAAHDELGQDGLRELINAVSTVNTLPQFSTAGGYHYVDWSNRDELIKISGKAPRTVAILEAVASGAHIRPAGVKPSISPEKRNP